MQIIERIDLNQAGNNDSPNVWGQCKSYNIYRGIIGKTNWVFKDNSDVRTGQVFTLTPNLWSAANLKRKLTGF